MTSIISIFNSRDNIIILSLFISTFLLSGVLDFLLVVSVSSFTASILQSTKTAPLFSSIINLDLSLEYLTITVLLFLLSSFISKLFALYLQGKLCFMLSSDLAISIYSLCIGRNPSFYSSFESVDLIGRVTVKTSHISYTVIYPFLTILATILSVFPLLLAMAYEFPSETSLLFLLTLPLLIITRKIFGNLIKKNSKKLNHYIDRIGSFLLSDFGDFHNIALSAKLPEYIDKFSKYDHKFRGLQRINQFYALLPRYIVELIISLVGIYFLVAYGNDGASQLVVYGSGLAIVAQRFLPHLNNINSALATVSGNINFLYDFSNFITEINNIKFDLPGKSLFRTRGIQKLSEINQKKHKFEKLTEFGEVRSIDIRSVSYSWNEGEKKQRLFEFDLNASAGQIIGIFGPSGCGKSTLALILAGLLRPTKGNIYLNKILINEENYVDYRSNISLCVQKTHVLQGSLLENVVGEFSSENLNNKDVEKALALTSLLEEFEGDLETQLSEDGRNISGGQRVRLGITRALYSNKGIVIFDEPTAGLNSKLAKEIYNNIKTNFTDKIVFVITHDENLKNQVDIKLDLEKLR